MKKAFVVLAALGVLATVPGCGQGEAKGVSGRAVRVLYEPAPPAAILNLAVSPEDISEQVRSVDEQYLAATALYSLRGDGVVQGTLQIARFNSAARPEDKEFREGMVQNLGGTEGIPTRIGDETVYTTQGRKHQVAAWFRGREVYVLTTRLEFEQPRALLREALKVGRS